MNSSNAEIAYSYWESGLSVMPKKRGEKRPDLPDWKKFSRRLPTPEEFDTFDFTHGVCIATGYASQNHHGDSYLEVLDFDNKTPNLNLFKVLQEWLDMVHDMNETLAKSVVIIETPSGGYHVPYFCSEVDKSQKIATNADGTVLIETRGVGGLVVSYPADGYKIIHNAHSYPLSNIPTVTPRERALMFAYARTFDAAKIAEVSGANNDALSDFVLLADVVAGNVPKAPQNTANTGNASQRTEWVGKTPFQDYNERGNALDILEAHGIRQVYRKGDKIVLRRDGTEAKSSGYWFTDNNLMYLFSTSTVFDAEKAYSQSAILCKLQFNDDWKACFKHLIQNGFGDKQPNDAKTYVNTMTPTASQVVEKRPYYELAWEFREAKMAEERAKKAAEARKDLTEALSAHKPVRYSDDVVLPSPLLFLEGESEPLLRHGQLGLIMGRSGTRKTSLLYALISTFLNNSVQQLGFSASSHGCKVMLIDTEQSEYSLVSRLRWIHKMAKGQMNDSNFVCFSIDQIRTATRSAFIKARVQEYRPSIVIIDGLLDLTLDANSLEHAQNTYDDMKSIMGVCGSTLIGILHENQGTTSHAKMVGHLGSTFDRKSELTIRVALNPDTDTESIISCQKRRDGQRFKEFTFRNEGGKFIRTAGLDFDDDDQPF